MYQDEIVLCGSSAYSRKFYLNEAFDSLPESIREELKIMCVLYTEDIGGTLQLVFDEEGTLSCSTECQAWVHLYDYIGTVLKIKKLKRDKAELLESLEMYFKVFFLGEEYLGEEGP